MSCMTWEKSDGENLVEHSENRYFISYISEPPTLQHIVAVSVAIRLWSAPDIKEDIRQYSEINGFDSQTETAKKIYKEYEERVRKKLAYLDLPSELKYKVSKTLLPIGLQLFKGFSEEIEEHCLCGKLFQSEYIGYCRFYDIYKMGGSLYWTMEGIIDNVASLKELINNEKQEKDYYGLYELACKYCLEECIPYLWKKISPKKKNTLDYVYENYKHHIVAYWTASVENKLQNIFDKLKQSDVNNIYDNNLSIEQNMISLSIFVKNPYSLKYFWYNLKEYERNVHLEKWLNLAISKDSCGELYEFQGYSDKTSNLCFLISQMNDANQQKEFFHAHSEKILKVLFYDWPWQRYFFPTFCLMLDNVSEETFVELMSIISDKIEKGDKLFRQSWLRSSLKLKRCLIQYLREHLDLLCNLFDNDDIETVFDIFKYATDAQRKQILFNMIERHTFFLTLCANKLGLIDSLMTKFLITSDDIDHFKYCLMSKYGSDLCKAWIDENDFQAVETLFKWGFKSSKEVREFKKNTLDKNKIYNSLVYLGDYELVDRFNIWYFESTDNIDKFKKALTYTVDEDNTSVCSDLLKELRACNEGWEYFEKFVNYTFSSPKEVAEFKNTFLESVTSFLESYRFVFAHKFLMWCLGSVYEVNRLKNSFVISKNGMNLLVRVVDKSYPFFYHPNELIKWFSLSEESVAVLNFKLDNIKLFSKHGRKNAADCKRWALLYMLNKHVGTDDTEYKQYGDEDIDISAEIKKAYKNRK